MFQNIVAQSRKTLPITAVYTAVMAFLFEAVDSSLWIHFLCILFTGYMMLLINNNNALIRIYSRLPSSIFLVLATMVTCLSKSFEANIVQALFALHLLMLFRAYQNKRGMGDVCASFIMLGIASTLFIQVLFFLPFAWLILLARMQAGSMKNFLASIMGLLVPYWFWFAYTLNVGDYTRVIDHLASIATFQPLCQGILNPSLLVNLVFVALTGIVAVTHFYRYSFHESIRTRMMFYSLILLFMLTLLFLVLQPAYSAYLLRMLIVSASPIIAHYFTFTKSRFTNWHFIATIFVILLLTVYNTWML